MSAPMIVVVNDCGANNPGVADALLIAAAILAGTVLAVVVAGHVTFWISDWLERRR